MALVEKCPKCGTLLPLKARGEARKCYFCGLALTDKPQVVPAPGGPMSAGGGRTATATAPPRAGGGGGDGGASGGAVVAGVLLLVAVGAGTFLFIGGSDNGSSSSSPKHPPEVASQAGGEPMAVPEVPEVARPSDPLADPAEPIVLEPRPQNVWDADEPASATCDEVGCAIDPDQACCRKKPKSSSLTREDILAVVRSGQGALVRCLDRELKTNPEFAPGGLKARLTIAANGRVSKLDIPATDSKKFDACVRRTVKAWRFRATASETSVVLPLSFG